MSAHAPAAHAASHAEDYHFQLGNNRMGLWLFILSDSFVFAGMMVARIYLMGEHRPHLNQGLGLLVTSVLLVSSFFMNRAEVAMSHGDRKNFLISIVITFFLGLGFLLGVVVVEWPTAIAEGVTPSSNTVGAVFFLMTGMHAFHVLTGLLFMAIVISNGLKNKYTVERHWAVEACANYWHFVDVVWIFFYPALYLIGTVAGG